MSRNGTGAARGAVLLELLEKRGAQPWTQQVVTVQYPKGRTIYAPGDTGDTLYVVRRGTVRLYRLSPDGREVTLTLLAAGDVFGELGLSASGGHSAFVEAVEDTEVALLTPRACHELITRHPEVAFELIGNLSLRLQRAEDLIEDLVSRDVAGRVARTLLHLAGTFGRDAERGTVINLRLPYQEIANLVGSTRETVTRAISQMQQNEWVRLEKGHLLILDRPALESLAA